MALVTAVLLRGLTSFKHCFVQMSQTLKDPSSEPDTCGKIRRIEKRKRKIKLGTRRYRQRGAAKEA